MNSKELITNEVDNLTEQVKDSLKNVKRFAVAEAWKILQVVTASVIQIIEKIGTDISSPEKKMPPISIKTVSVYSLYYVFFKRI